MRKHPEKGNEKFDASGGREFDFFSLALSEKGKVSSIPLAEHSKGNDTICRCLAINCQEHNLKHIILNKQHEVSPLPEVPILFWRLSWVEVFKISLFKGPPVFREIMYALFYHSSVVPNRELRDNNAILMPINSNCWISSRLSAAAICELEKRRQKRQKVAY